MQARAVLPGRGGCESTQLAHLLGYHSYMILSEDKVGSLVAGSSRGHGLGQRAIGRCKRRAPSLVALLVNCVLPTRFKVA